MLGEVEGAAFQKSTVTPTDAASRFGASVRALMVGRKNDVYLRSMMRMAIRVLSASDAFAPSFDPERTHTEFAY